MLSIRISEQEYEGLKATCEARGSGSISDLAREAVCRLRAVDTSHVEVGARDVRLPRGQADLQFTERLRTSATATSGDVQYCYLVQ